MGTVTLNKASRLYWLGRYTERVYTCLKYVKKIVDEDVDGREADYAGYCASLGIPNEYASTAEFVHNYLLEVKNPNSVASNLVYAYDNAIVLRDTLTTETLSYVLMALGAMDAALESNSPALELQSVLDYMMAFRGSCDENVADDICLAIIKLGVSVERTDLYLRLGMAEETTRREFEKLFNRMYKTQLDPASEKLDALIDSVLDNTKPNLPPHELLSALEGLFPYL